MTRAPTALAVLAAFLALAAPAAAQDFDVEIRRTAHGIPHIQARDFGSLAYGYGYAFAQDNICPMAEQYVTVRGERSRFFGPDGTWQLRGNGSTNRNLESDFFFKRIIAQGTIEKLMAQPPPMGPRPQILEGVRGYAAGYNRYLADTGVPRCGVGAPDRGDRRPPALLPARAAGLERRRDQRHRRRAAPAAG